MILLKNKYDGIIHAIIPALLLQLASGSVYCFSLYKSNIAILLNTSDSNVLWFFTVVIGMLGISAAFMGSVVEKNIHLSSALATILFAVGMITIGLGLHFNSYLLTLLGFALLGSGTGISYVSPIKTLVIYYPKKQGLISGLSIMAFGLSKTIFTPIINGLQNNFGTEMMFYIMAIIFFISMFIGHLLLRKPLGWEETTTKVKVLPAFEMFKNKKFVLIFFVFWISVNNGLLLISSEKQLLQFVGCTVITLVCSMTALFNAIGRIGSSAISDKLNNRIIVYISCSALAGLMCVISVIFKFDITQNVIGIIALLIIVNIVYGQGFSCLPSLLNDQFGIGNLSKNHATTLIAWSLGAISSTIILNIVKDYHMAINVMFVLYFVECILSLFVLKNSKE